MALKQAYGPEDLGILCSGMDVTTDDLASAPGAGK